jgi:hypothetical protein
MSVAAIVLTQLYKNLSQLAGYTELVRAVCVPADAHMLAHGCVRIFLPCCFFVCGFKPALLRRSDHAY